MKILSEWFGTGFSLPVAVTDITLLLIGLIPGLKIRSSKTVLKIMLACVIVFIIACFLAVCGIAMIEPYAVYLGALCLFSFAGFGIALLIRLPKEKKSGGKAK